jgi:hypothetical protein
MQNSGNIEQDFQEVSDLNLMAYLKAIGHEPAKEIDHPFRLILLFKKSPELTEQLTAFYQGRAMVEANRLLLEFNTLRTIVRKMRRY